MSFASVLILIVKAPSNFDPGQSVSVLEGRIFQMRSATWKALFWLLCVALLFALAGPNDLDSDEGVALNGAWNLIHGRDPYTDFFEFVAPGSFYLVALAWNVFGPSYGVAKFVGLSATLATAVAVWMIGDLLAGERSRGLPPVLGALAVCLSSSFFAPITHNNFSMALVLWSAYFIVRTIQRRSVPDAVMAGGIAGAAFLFTQHRGMFAAAAVGFFVVMAIKQRQFLWAKAGIAFTAASLIAPVLVLTHWPMQVLMSQLIEFPAYHYIAVNRSEPYFLLGAVSVIAATGYVLRHEFTAPLFFLFTTQSALLASTLQRPDFAHLAPALFPALCMLPALCRHLQNASRATRLAAKWAVCCLLLPPLAIGLLRLSYNAVAGNSIAETLTEAVRTHCATPYIYAGPFEPGVYFETSKFNATRFSFLLTGMHDGQQFEEATIDLKQHRADCVITNYEKVRQFGYDTENVLDRYISSNYQPKAGAGSYQLWVLRDR